MNPLFDYPQNIRYGKIVPKSKIYDKGRPSARIKKLFVSQVSQIIWAYSIVSKKVNIPESESVPAIQVFHIKLRVPELHNDVLRIIDRAILSPIIFELYYNDKVQVAAAYKRPSESDSSKSVIGDHYFSPILPCNAHRSPLPVVLNLERLYHELLLPLMPAQPQPSESVRDYMDRVELITAKQHEIRKLKKRLKAQKQFNRKVELNSLVNALKKELEALTAAS